MKLRDYQTSNSLKLSEILKKYGIAYYAAEPRTGKTITALEVMRLLGKKNILFVTKKKAKDSIYDDIKHFLSLDVTVVNYGSEHKITGIYDAAIIDEAHSLGAYPKPSVRAKELKKSCFGLPILFLSGTPTPESYSQLYHQFYISGYSPWRNFFSFYKWADTFVVKKSRIINGYSVNDYSGARIDAIKRDTEHLFLSFTQEQSGFNVAITERIETVPLSDEQKQLLNAIMKDKICQINGKTILADTPVKIQSKVHQLCSGTVIDEEKGVHIISTAKAEYIHKTYGHKKVVVFYKFQGELDALKAVFNDEWTDSQNEFQSGQKRAYFGQFVSSREGVKLDTADLIVFYNIDFSYLSYAQAKERIISKDRTEQAPLVWLFSDGGIERKIHKAVANKQDYTNYYFKKDYGKYL
jgi:hypothetical protein